MRPFDLATRLRAAIVLCLLIVVVAAAYVTSNVVEGRAASRGSEPTALSGDLLDEPHVLVRSLEPGPDHGRVAVVPVDDPQAPRALTPMQCERVAAAGGGGVCLQRTSNQVDPFKAVLFDDRLQEGEELPLTGIPSRARVSPDGRYAATTTFVSGHSYAQAGFSTETLVHDVVDDQSTATSSTSRSCSTARFTTAST